MKLNNVLFFVSVVSLCGLMFGSTVRGEGSELSIFQATLIEPDQKTPNISTEEMHRILGDKSATVFDARAPEEYSVSHIPGALNARTVPIIDSIVQGDKGAAIVLYCNGLYCGQSKRLANKLLSSGYANVRRYQLGIPVWRALGGVTEIELEAVRYVAKNDKTAVLIDARDPDEFKVGSIPDARNLPHSGVKLDSAMTAGGGRTGGGEELKKAKKDGRLPVNDRNTRIIVFGKDGAQASVVAQALTTQAFHNTSYFSGSFETLRDAIADRTYE